MLSASTVNDVNSTRNRDSESPSDMAFTELATPEHLPHESHVGSGDSIVNNVCSSDPASSFVGHVCHIFWPSTEKMVIWIAARRIITLVENAFFSWVYPPVEKVGHPVGEHYVSARDSDLSVSHWFPVALPFPAFVVCSSVDFRPEPSHVFFRETGHFSKLVWRHVGSPSIACWCGELQ